ncbi:cytoplasmic protein [Rhodotorula toruloides]
MQSSWKSFATSLQSVAGQAASTVQGATQNIDFNTTGKNLSKGFATFSQTVREKAGQVNEDDVTELPQEYLDLERRVDGLRLAHQKLLRVAKAYEGHYDYPVNLGESATEIGGSLAHNLSAWAAAATKGTHLPQPQVAEKPVEVQKTLPHALSRAAASGAVEVGPGRLSNVLKTYAVTQDKVGTARTRMDEDISKNFLQPWSATLNSSIQAAMKARQNVTKARVSLDATRAQFKNATGQKQEQSRMEVEAAEEHLVEATEQAINLMRSVLENPEPIKNIHALLKAQQTFYAEASEALASVLGEVEEAGTQAEAEWRSGRSRHKKCDETHLPEHGESCKRCFDGNWVCQWPVAGGGTLRTFVRGAAKEKRETNGPASVGRRERERALVMKKGERRNSMADGREDVMNGSAVDGTSAASTSSLSPYPSTSLPPISRQSFAQTAYPNLSAPMPAFAMPLPSMSPSDYPASTSAHPYLATSAPLASFYNPAASPPALVNPAATLALETNDLSQFFQSLDAEFANWDGVEADPLISPVGPAGPAASLAEASGAALALGTEIDGANGPSGADVVDGRGRLPRLDFSNTSVSDGPASAVPIDDAEPTSVHQDYSTFNNGFFRSLPKPLRDIVVQKVHNVVTTTELGRNAAMAIVMLYRLRLQQQQRPPDPADSTPVDGASNEDQQARLLAQSNHYFQRALEHLQTPIPLEAKMIAMLDLQTFQFDQFGAAAANAMLLLGEVWINEALGSQPTLDLSAMRDPANALLTAIACTDCLRCISIPGRRTIFSFPDLPGDPSNGTPSAVVSDVSAHKLNVDTHLGLPVGLLLCVAATTNLSCDMEALPDELVRVKADAIEAAIRGWRPPPPSPHELADPVSFHDKASTAEMWRYATLVFLYQAVHRRGPLNRVIREASQQIISIGSRMLQPNRPNPASHRAAPSAGPSAAASPSSAAPGSPHDSPLYDDYLSAPSTRAVPWLLAGTCALTPSDRALCRQGMLECGKQLAYQDDVAALERVWEVVDEQGWGVEWRALLQSEGRAVAFL